MGNQNEVYQIEKSSICLNISQKIYPLEAILNSTYHFIDDFYIYLNPAAASSVQVELKAKEKQAKSALDAAAGNFFNTLLSEALRLKLNEKSRKFREELLEQAVSSALSPPKPGEAAAPAEELELDEELKRIIEKTKNMSYTDDPLGIAVPVDEEPKKKTSQKKKADKK